MLQHIIIIQPLSVSKKFANPKKKIMRILIWRTRLTKCIDSNLNEKLSLSQRGNQAVNIFIIIQS